MAVDNSDLNPIGGVIEHGTVDEHGQPVEPQKIKYANGTKTARAPATYVWKLNDVSSADSGRTEDAMMHKNMVGQVVGIELSWTNLPTDEASAIINAFQPEYVDVNYLDLKVGGYTTAEFYVGDRSAPMYNSKLNLWSNVSFNLIRRSAQW